MDRSKLSPKDNTRYQKLVDLSWWILEQKLKYYKHGYGEPVSDEKYDKYETLYKNLCAYFKVEPTASNHVGFPEDTPSGRMVMDKMIRKKKGLGPPKLRIVDGKKTIKPKDNSVIPEARKRRTRGRRKTN